MNSSFDLLVIGGGINGAAVARDAAGRGLKVMLAERGDYACGTSSASSGLIHGGLRYLESYNFGLVRESLKERARLLKNAPHLVHPMRFLLPITDGQPRARALVRAGLALYDLFSRRGRLPRGGRLSNSEIDALPRFRREDVRAVLHYYDAQGDDARLVLANLLDARARGADVLNYRAVTAITLLADGYAATVDERGLRREVQARIVVNAAGPWAAQVDALCVAHPPAKRVRLVRGSHIVLPMPEPATRDAYTIQTGDGRIVFVLPWLENQFLVIGTTDAPQTGAPEDAVCTPEERDYLLDAYNSRFMPPAKAEDIVHSWSGVRALVDNGAARPSRVTREASLSARAQGAGGMVTVYGGKLTTHRALAEDVMDALAKLGAELGPRWTADAPLHGGTQDRAALLAEAERGPSSVDARTRRRWALTYGDRIGRLFDSVAAQPQLADEVAPGVPEVELMHAVETEDAVTSDDFLLRRTKLGLNLDEGCRRLITAWIADYRGSA